MVYRSSQAFGNSGKVHMRGRKAFEAFYTVDKHQATGRRFICHKVIAMYKQYFIIIIIIIFVIVAIIIMVVVTITIIISSIWPIGG